MADAGPSQLQQPLSITRATSFGRGAASRSVSGFTATPPMVSGWGVGVGDDSGGGDGVDVGDAEVAGVGVWLEPEQATAKSIVPALRSRSIDVPTRAWRRRGRGRSA